MKSLKFFAVMAIVSVALLGSSHALPVEETGSISGVVHPADAMAIVEATYYGEVVASVEADPTTGEFTLDGLQAGTYDLVITPGGGEYESKTVSDVTVDAGENKDLGDLYLE